MENYNKFIYLGNNNQNFVSHHGQMGLEKMPTCPQSTVRGGLTQQNINLTPIMFQRSQPPSQQQHSSFSSNQMLSQYGSRVSQNVFAEFTNPINFASEKTFNSEWSGSKRKTGSLMLLTDKNNNNKNIGKFTPVSQINQSQQLLGLMPRPNSLKEPVMKKMKLGTVSDIESQEQSEKKSRPTIRNLTGTIDRVMKWHLLNLPSLNLYEILSRIIAVQDADTPNEKVVLVRDQVGPILQVVYYETDYISPPIFFVGQMIRCVGIMTGRNKLRAFNVRDCLENEQKVFKRLCCICEHTVDRLLLH